MLIRKVLRTRCEFAGWSSQQLQPAVLSCQMPSILSSSPAPTVAYNLSFRVLYEVQTNVNATSLHGRDLEGLVGVATGLLASRDVSRCRREDPAGPRPTDLSAARDVFPSGQYPGYRIPSLIHRLVPSPFFFSSRESRPHEQWIWSMS